MDPAILGEESALVLDRAERNDPSLTHLYVYNTPNFVEVRFPRRGGASRFWFNNDRDELSRLGRAIAKNTHLRELSLNHRFGILGNDDEDHELEDAVAGNTGFFEGLKCNGSIKKLHLSGHRLSEGGGREILNEFVAVSSNLKEITLADSSLDNGVAGTFASAVVKRKDLDRINMLCCNADGEHFAEFISGIAGLPQLHSLSFIACDNFGRPACEALASLLQDPSCNINAILLCNDFNIDDDCAEALASSMKGNNKLEGLDLDGCRITARGWEAFSKVLGNESNINDTFFSNHTVTHLGENELDGNLSSLLDLNRGIDKKKVAMKKILRCHPDLDMEPILEWDLKVLPFSVNWFDRARGCVEDNEVEGVDARKLSAIYQIARAVPLMFVPSSKSAGSKRKLEGSE